MNAIEKLIKLSESLSKLEMLLIRKDDTKPNRDRHMAASMINRHARDAIKALYKSNGFEGDPADWIRWHASSVAGWRKIVEVGQAILDGCPVDELKRTLTEELLRNDFGDNCTCPYTRANAQSQRVLVCDLLRYL